MIVASAGALITATATGAGAAPPTSFDFHTRTGFISRSEVVARVGADGLVVDPMVTFQSTQSFTETCTWEDGTSVQASGSHWAFLLFRAGTRYAPGSATITGYTLSPGDVVDGGTSPAGEDRYLCWQALGKPDDGSEITQTYAVGPSINTLTFFGPGGGVDLPFVTAGASTPPQ